MKHALSGLDPTHNGRVPLETIYEQPVFRDEQAPDTELCITFQSFKTDLDLDTLLNSGFFHRDEPYAQACFQGRCMSTSSSKGFQGNKVTWGEEKCMKVRRSHLFGDDAGSLAFVVKEQSPRLSYSNQYTQQQVMMELDALGFAESYDFFYAPMDKQTKCTVGYAFVNFLGPDTAARCMRVMPQHPFQRQGGHREKQARVSIAHLQGLEANIKHYQNTAVTGSNSGRHSGPIIKPSISKCLVAV